MFIKKLSAFAFEIVAYLISFRGLQKDYQCYTKIIVSLSIVNNAIENKTERFIMRSLT